MKADIISSGCFDQKHKITFLKVKIKAKGYHPLKVEDGFLCKCRRDIIIRYQSRDAI